VTDKKIWVKITLRGKERHWELHLADVKQPREKDWDNEVSVQF